MYLLTHAPFSILTTFVKTSKGTLRTCSSVSSPFPNNYLDIVKAHLPQTLMPELPPESSYRIHISQFSHKRRPFFWFVDGKEDGKRGKEWVLEVEGKVGLEAADPGDEKLVGERKDE